MEKNSKSYQSSEAVYRPSDGTTIELPKNLIGTYIDPALWAYSTLPPCDTNELVNVYVVQQSRYQGRDMVRQRMWLHDILDDEGIPYQVVIKSRWSNRKRYNEDQFIYVEEKYERKAKKLIKAFAGQNNTVPEIHDNEASPENYKDGILQVKCVSCGDEIDFDYSKCPSCKQDPRRT